MTLTVKWRFDVTLGLARNLDGEGFHILD